MANPMQQYEEFFVDAAKIMIETMKDIFKDSKEQSYEVKFPKKSRTIYS
jgi:SHS2 domain-containing protein